MVAPEESGGGAAALTSTADGGDSRKVPKSLVIRKGKTAAELGELVTDLRRLMLPFTAVHFQDDPKNRKLTLQQYCTHLALPMGITHILQFTQKEERCHLRLARLPEGPVLTFRVHQFSLSRHIVRLQKRPIAWHPDAGSVEVDGQNVHKLKTSQLYALRKRMGMLFQFGALFTDLTVFENVAFPLREHTRLPEA